MNVRELIELLVPDRPAQTISPCRQRDAPMPMLMTKESGKWERVL